MKDDRLSLQVAGSLQSSRVLALGEVLWDIFPDSKRLGGAPLNFAAHVKRMGHEVALISAVGEDDLGKKAIEAIHCLGLNTELVQTTDRFPTGTACVQMDPAGHTNFSIQRPAAYDAVHLSQAEIRMTESWSPEWFYFGTLFAATPDGHDTLIRLLSAVPEATRFYDLNLRPGFDSPALVCELLQAAQVVKLNQHEMHAVARFCGLPSETEAFCRAGCRRFEWDAVCVTMGARGCAVLARAQYVEAAGWPVQIADTVGAGDAFAAAFLHGLVCNWDVAEIARFSNRVGALVASRPGAIPDWTLAETAQL